MSSTPRWSVALALLLLAGWSSSCTCCDDELAASAPVATSTQHAVAGAHADDEDDAVDDDDGEEGEEEEQAIALDQVPADILAAAQAALPGAVFTSAELEQEGGLFVYCLEGYVGDERVEVEVAADGRVLEIERGEDD